MIAIVIKITGIKIEGFIPIASITEIIDMKKLNLLLFLLKKIKYNERLNNKAAKVYSICHIAISNIAFELKIPTKTIDITTNICSDKKYNFDGLTNKAENLDITNSNK
ncbi:hypothetical protein GCM10011450_27180 [Advenella faeciporci]|uniref:Uncharacterized protein n=1 Tax=Advenella faeciporci TaxID=797535 RepID=A0A918JQK6_9BURK|nr:hypothetical protein GCM10011450_27180 [Advenella faeciporci]